MIETNLLRPQHIAEMRLYGIVGHLMGLRSRLRDADEKRRLDFQKRYIPNSSRRTPCSTAPRSFR